ncbi:MAG: hypothetical protein K2V38_16060 [Gemmataceae bacterium]|nr:hypothetical protein [Gemmataceae bacterium]
MKRFFGGILALAGGAATVWALVHIMSGKSDARIGLTNDLSVSAMMAGLVGVLVLTLGLVWSRD